jgi:hypothetical protein
LLTYTHTHTHTQDGPQAQTDMDFEYLTGLADAQLASRRVAEEEEE